MSAQNIAVVLFDPLFLIRKGISALLQSLPDFSLIDEFEEPDMLLNSLKHRAPGLLVLNISELDSNLIEKINSITKNQKTEILVISNIPPNNNIQHLLKMGIKGIVSQTCSEDEIINAIKLVSKGKRFLCHCMLELIASDESSKSVEHESVLTARELEVLQLIAQGYSSSRISSKLYISLHTVNSHRKNIIKKLKLKSPIQLVTYAVENGMVKIKK